MARGSPQSGNCWRSAGNLPPTSFLFFFAFIATLSHSHVFTGSVWKSFKRVGRRHNPLPALPRDVRKAAETRWRAIEFLRPGPEFSFLCNHGKCDKPTIASPGVPRSPVPLMKTRKRCFHPGVLDHDNPAKNEAVLLQTPPALPHSSFLLCFTLDHVRHFPSDPGRWRKAETMAASWAVCTQPLCLGGPQAPT